MIKAALFDLDGTLVDSIAQLECAGNEVLAHFGLKQLPQDNYRSYAGDGAKEFVQRFMRDGGDPDGKLFDEAYKLYKDFFRRDYTYKVCVFDGMLECLEEIKKRGIKLAVVSNKPHERTVLLVETLFGKDRFDVILGQKDGMKRKPEPDGALLVARELGVFPEECAFIGDMGVDMLTGTNAGMYRIGVTWGFSAEKELIENGAECIARGVLEIKDLISFK